MLKECDIFAVDMSTRVYILPYAPKQLLLLSAAFLIALSSYAALGLGKKKSSLGSKKLLSAKVAGLSANFSLKSGYNYRGTTVLETPTPQVINIHSEITAQQGNLTFTIPLRKKIIVNSIKIGIGNEAFKSH
jgi:hypothetical protein